MACSGVGWSTRTADATIDPNARSNSDRTRDNLISRQRARRLRALDLDLESCRQNAAPDPFWLGAVYVPLRLGERKAVRRDRRQYKRAALEPYHPESHRYRKRRQTVPAHLHDGAVTALSRGGSLLFAVSRSGRPVVALRGRQIGRSLAIPKPHHGASRHLCRAAVASLPHKRRLHLISADGGESSPLARELEVEGSTDWSLDGKRIVTGGSDPKGRDFSRF